MRDRLQELPPLREAPTAADDRDGNRLELVKSLWHSQDSALLLRDRTVEEGVRMLAGQQWSVWSPLLGRFLDVTEWMSEEERRWRQRPVLNRLLPWYILTHATLTENPPIITFLPGPDAIDSELAETQDIIFKSFWRDLDMADNWDRVAMWMMVAGRGHWQTRLDLTKGDFRPWVGQAELPILDGTSLQPTGRTAMHPEVPFDHQGQPLVHGILPNGELLPMTDAEGNITPPHATREGGLAVDVLSPLEVRGQWGPSPWHRKGWHQVRSYLTPEDVWTQYGVDAEPDVFGVAADNAGYLQRLLFGSGYWGASSKYLGSEDARSTAVQGTQGYCEVTTYWRRPIAAMDQHIVDLGLQGMVETPDSPGGRLLVTTRTKVLSDGPRPGRFKNTSPVRAFDFIRLPGRAHGSTPLEALLGVQRAYNRGAGQILEHRNLVTNPKHVIDSGSGMGNIVVTNKPGEGYTVNRRPNVPPFEWIAPPSLSGDVWKTQQMLLEEMLDIGMMRGAEATPPTDDASGELVKELRFNRDRFIGPPLRRAVDEIARTAEDWMVFIPLLYDREKILQYAGEDNIARTLTVYPHLFELGTVNVVPDAESMLPEGRGERQARLYKMWQDGMFGFPPQDPKAIRTYLEQSRFPHLGRSVKPGGKDQATAEQFLGRLLEGEPAQSLPLYPWYDLTVHLDVLESYMKKPEFLKLPPPLSQNLIARWTQVSGIIQQQMAAAQAQAMAQAAAMNPGGPPSKNGAPNAAPPLTPGPASPPRSVAPGVMPTALSTT